MSVRQNFPCAARRQRGGRPEWPPPDSVRRALDAVRPKAVVLVEGEMWPNFVWTCRDRKIPVVLTNARVSPRSA
ncbi:MAG: glycosyltransferase N-terminal domain-containing protein, partial [Chthoniobacterales bacterium]